MGCKQAVRGQITLLSTLLDALYLTVREGKTVAEAIETLPPGEHYEAGVVSVRKSLYKYLTLLSAV